MTDPNPPRRRLGFAAAAVLLASADTYVVVLALPAIMGDVGISLDHLQRATPIVSGFLLGYVAMLPLLGRLGDIYGRTPVFLTCLASFALGSLVTAGAGNLVTVVIGRTVQGLGGGGLVPVTLALVADMWPEGRRGVPLGIVGAVQELGSVLGPAYGAAIITVSSWRTIFWINLPLAGALGVAFAVSRTPQPASRRPARGRTGRFDGVGVGLLTGGGAAALGAFLAPPWLTSNLVTGQLYQPLAGDAGATTAIALTGSMLLIAFVAWECAQPWSVRPLVPLRRIPTLWQHVDWLGAGLLAAVLGCVVMSFAAADPSTQVVADAARFLIPAAVVLTGMFVVRECTTVAPLIDFARFRNRAAGGALLTNLMVGAALMAMLIDVPIFARSTTFPDSQVEAALVLVRFLAAVPAGALIGGLICQRLSYRLTTAAGMGLSSTMFVVMTRWDEHTLAAAGLLGTPVRWSDVTLAACGLGFGMTIAPINAAILAVTRSSVHGLASALVVVARMIGMLAGLSVLTGLGLRTFYAADARIASPYRLCPHSPANCVPYNLLVTHAIIEELRVIFAGAAVCAAMAALLGLALLRRPAIRATMGGKALGVV